MFFFCFLFIINGRTWNVQHWILVWIKIAMTSRQNSRPIIGKKNREKWRVIIYLRKGSVNCRQNFNVKNNILLEANLFFIDWNSNELWRAMDQDVTVGWHVRSHSVCFYLIAFQFVHIFLVVCWFLQRVFEFFLMRFQLNIQHHHIGLQL